MPRRSFSASNFRTHRSLCVSETLGRCSCFANETCVRVDVLVVVWWFVVRQPGHSKRLTPSHASSLVPLQQILLTKCCMCVIVCSALVDVVLRSLPPRNLAGPFLCSAFAFGCGFRFRVGVCCSFFTPQNFKQARGLIKILEEAKQDVPEELRRLDSMAGGAGCLCVCVHASFVTVCLVWYAGSANSGSSRYGFGGGRGGGFGGGRGGGRGGGFGGGRW